VFGATCKECWDGEKHPITDIERIVTDTKASGSPLVVVTGGEPLMYNLAELTKQLHNAGLRVHMVTSGTHPLSGQWSWMTLSPKKFKVPLADSLEYADWS